MLYYKGKNSLNLVPTAGPNENRTALFYIIYFTSNKVHECLFGNF